MKIYLSTAITRGRREYVDAIKNILDALKEEGVDVLNERVADPNFPDPQTDRAETMRELNIWLDAADALIAEATISSTGVGCELTQAQMRNKPVLLLYDAHFGFRISDWVTHNPEANVEAQPYRDRNEIARIVKEFVGGVKTAKG
ncbi:MAG TPA: hypothetical protein VJ253_02920 [Dehalococcoidia bacterium]|nr:hypothetical protein [Dehalococcoidia bacterium]